MYSFSSDKTQRYWIIGFRRFNTTEWSHLQSWIWNSSWTFLPSKMIPQDCLNTPGTSKPAMRRHNAQERTPQLNNCENQKAATDSWFCRCAVKLVLYGVVTKCRAQNPPLEAQSCKKNYGTQRFISVFTPLATCLYTEGHECNPNPHSQYPYFILILSRLLRPGLPIALPLSFPTKFLHAFLALPTCTAGPLCFCRQNTQHAEKHRSWHPLSTRSSNVTLCLLAGPHITAQMREFRSAFPCVVGACIWPDPSGHSQLPFVIISRLQTY